MMAVFVGWGGVALLICPIAGRVGGPGRVGAALVGQIGLWTVWTATLLVVRLHEQLDWSSLWLRPPSWQSVVWGLAFAVVSVTVVVPLRERVRRLMGLSGFAAGMEEVIQLPPWFRLYAAVSAGIVEETLFSGVPIPRLALVTGSVWLGALIATAVFAAVHVPHWGTGAAVSIFLGALAGAAFFVWRRDLLAIIVAHAAIDVWGFVIAPRFSKWWRAASFA